MNNPFEQNFETRLGAVPFGAIRNEHYMPAIQEAIGKALDEIDAITSNLEKPTFANTIVALERSGSDLDRVLNVFYPLLSANADDAMMEISLEASPLLSEYSTSVSLNEKLWERIKLVYDSRDSLSLDPEDEMLLEETYNGFARSGALLNEEEKAEFRKISARISELTTIFGQNVLKELNTYEIWLSSGDLEGLPEDVVESSAHAAEEKGRPGEYLFTLDQPVYMAFMKYSSRRDLREKMFRLYSGRNMSGEYSNIGIITELTELRLKMARLLGRETFADFVLEHTMAGTPEKVYRLLHSLRDAYRPALEKEMENLQTFAESVAGKGFTLKPWDYSYFANKLKEKEYSYDEEALRPYFKLENVIEGVFGLATRLYGITFVEARGVEVYHPDVKVFEVHDSDGSYLGLLYTDFFPRASKRPGAWMTDFKGEWTEPDGTVSRPHVSLVMNFTKPTPSKPSLLTPMEVSTFLHEFGHALHGLLANTRYASLSGTNVRRDFVELPSQFNENFLHCKEFLDSFARHYLTGEPIPAEFVARMVNAARFGAAYSCMRQLNFGLVDMAWHSIKAPVKDVAAFENEAGKSVRIFEPVEGALVSPQFSHIFSGGYAAGYYSYKWAEVLDADAFSKFDEAGLFDSATALSFRKNILEKGGTENPALLYRRFRGHEPQIEALLRRDGIIS